MAYRIIHSPHWEGCTHLIDSRGEDHYAYAEMNNAHFLQSDEITGEMCFKLADGRTAWITSTDIEVVEPYSSSLLYEPYELDPFIAYWKPAVENDTDFMDWMALAQLTHKRQVAIFNWCGCEDGERQYDDCPTTNQGDNNV